MCQYCGCRDLPLIRDYIAEHAHVLNLGGEAVRRIDRGDLDTARRLLAEMAQELETHWRGEEHGLFKVLLREDLFAEHIEPLIREHRELARLLASVDLARDADRQAVRVAVGDLWERTPARRRTASSRRRSPNSTATTGTPRSRPGTRPIPTARWSSGASDERPSLR
ncbi:hemerythrin domain-containing protein [Mycolicibacterium celeriflavum]|uniref:hemerythrin domain-containing protein n=1 Tax=Mycolicibacterium celeriflavum TaxID=1249101 RepID=UPI003CF552FE